jgi:glycosidase
VQAIYQIMTDRFAMSDNGTTRCTHFQKYCGGTFKGIVNRIPYIKQMGFTAVWISPVQSQTKGLTWSVQALTANTAHGLPASPHITPSYTCPSSE